MKRYLVIQLARFGDLIQTKRLMASLATADPVCGEPGEVHLLTDASLTDLAARIYPYAVTHGVAAHGLPLQDNRGNKRAAATVMAAGSVFDELSKLDFDRVFCLNFSGLALAASAAFDPERVAGYRLVAGQVHKDVWTRLAFRWTRNRRMAGMNLADFWAALAPFPAPPESVNPAATPQGGGVGVALAGRNARRALPPEVLANVVQTVFAARGGARLVLFGTSEQAPIARELMKRLKPGVLDKTVNLCGKTGLTGLIDEVSNLDLLLTPDTGIMHLAAHLGVPVEAFFLSSAWCHETGPYGAGHVIWQSVVPSAPCLEAAPCPENWRCLEAFKDRAFLALLRGASGKEPPEGLAGFRTAFDALGASCEPFTGNDPSLAARRSFRAFAAKHLGLGAAADFPATPEMAEALYLETDWTLKQRGAFGA